MYRAAKGRKERIKKMEGVHAGSPGENRSLINCTRKYGRHQANYEPRLVGRLGLLGAFLLDFLDLVDKVVGLF
jgi:hypothetical protein